MERIQMRFMEWNMILYKNIQSIYNFIYGMRLPLVEFRKFIVKQKHD